MKKLFVTIVSVLMMCTTSIKAQIVYEHSYPGPNSQSAGRPIIINMGNNDYKYMYLDYDANQLNLFNLDHTVFRTVNIPIPLIGSSQYGIGYVTWSLFDCDTAMFEYVLLPANYRNTFYIIREDGTILFQQDSTIGPWSIGYFDLSYVQKAIYNTPVGTKLFLAKANSSGYFMTVDVYALCDSLPVNVMDLKVAPSNYANAAPNPSNGIIEFRFALPDNMQHYELILHNSSNQRITTAKIHGTSKSYQYDGSRLSSGVYFFTLQTEKGRVLDTGKFIINK